MDKTVRKVASAAEQQRETYRYWQGRSDAERMNTTWELSLERYDRKGLLHMHKDFSDLLSAFGVGRRGSILCRAYSARWFLGAGTWGCAPG
jgi:hypothetical protein